MRRWMLWVMLAVAVVVGAEAVAWWMGGMTERSAAVIEEAGTPGPLADELEARGRAYRGHDGIRADGGGTDWRVHGDDHLLPTGGDRAR